MGTNYYHVRKCEHCGQRESLHIGKSSMGLVMLIRAHLELGIDCWADWKKRIAEKADFAVEDEYGETVAADDLVRMVESPHESKMYRLGRNKACEAWDETYSEFS